jgi:Asp-tRNA(Asn)/Glu-tRNA(Gln) amidotransferase A subunit family amidase
LKGNSMPLADEKLLTMPITHLVQAQIRGEVSAVEIVQCYLRRAEQINEATNCFTCWVPEALDEARRCDRHLAETGKPLGRLHGIPCTIKDHYAMKGLPVTMGLKTMRERMNESGGARHDAVAVLALRAEAVGSSSSVFGIGSDVGGSVRCPAAFCGVAGLKPTAQRFSFGWEDGRTILNKAGDYGVLATGGPLAKNVADLAEVMKVCWSKDSPMLNIDTRVPPIAFDEQIMASTRQLTIGYHVGGGYTQPAPCPSTVRCVDRIVKALTEAGHNMVPFDPNDVVPWEELHPVLLAEYGVGVRPEAEVKAEQAPKKEREGSYSSKSTDTTIDEIHPDLAAMSLTSKGPGELLPIPTNAGEYHSVIAMRDRQRDLLSRHWRQAGLDVLICPAWAFPAPPVEEVRNLSPAVWTTQAWNYFDVPAGVLPVGRVTDADLDVPWEIQVNPPSVEADFREACLRSREGSAGLPIALQVVGQPWREETVLRAMLEIERVAAQVADELGAEHHLLNPTPRRSPSMGDRPEAI